MKSEPKLIILVLFLFFPILAQAENTFDLNHYVEWEREASLNAVNRYDRFLKTRLSQNNIKSPNQKKSGDKLILSSLPGQTGQPILFKADISDKIYRNHLPSAENIEFDQFSMTGALNEWESLQFGVYSPVDLQGVYFEISDLVHEKGKSVIQGAGRNLRKYTVYNILAKKKKSRQVSPDMDINPEINTVTFHYEEEPVLLLDLPRIDIKADTSQAFWLDLFIPESSYPGIYSGYISIMQDQNELKKVPFILEILPFELDMALEWSRGAYISKFIDKKEAVNLIEHGHTQVSWWTDANYTIKINQGQVTADFSPYVKYLEMLDEVGMAGPHTVFLGGDSPKLINKIFTLLGRPTITNGRNVNNRHQYEATDLSEPFESYFIQTLKQFHDQMEQAGHGSILAAILDEPDHKPRPERLDWYNRIFSMMEASVPELQTFGVFYRKNNEKMLSHDHDVWSTNSPSIKKYNAVKKAGKKLFTYHGGFRFYKSAGMPRFRVGIIPWVYDAAGTFYWAIWNHSDNDRRLDDIFSPDIFAGRAITIARAPQGASYGPLNTLVHKGFREAVDDARYIKTLEKMIKKAKGTSAGAEAKKHEKWLNHIKLTLRKKMYVRGGRVYNHKEFKDWRFPVASLTFYNSIGEKCNLENFEKFSEFIRTDIQRRIVSLLKAMDKI